jgi:hypothetical protein
LADWVRIESGQTINGVPNSTTITIDVDGAGSGTIQQIIQLEGAHLGTDLSLLQNLGVFRHLGGSDTPVATVVMNGVIDTRSLTLDLGRESAAGSLSPSEGAVLKGKVTPNAALNLTLGAVSHTVTANAAGEWSWTLQAAQASQLSQGLETLTLSYSQAGQAVEKTHKVLLTDAHQQRSLESTEQLPVSYYTTLQAREAQQEHMAYFGSGGIYYDAYNATSEEEFEDRWKTLAAAGIKSPYVIYELNPLLHYMPTGTRAGIEKYGQERGFLEAYKALSDPNIHKAISAWYLPEEVRDWVGDEMALVRGLESGIRAAEALFDRKPMPIRQYQPNHADNSRLDDFQGVFDIISKGTYLPYGGSISYKGKNVDAYEFVRASADELVLSSRNSVGGVANAGAVGGDFTPVIALGSSEDPSAGATRAEVALFQRISAYLALSRGAQGIDIWHHYHYLPKGLSKFWQDHYFSNYFAITQEINEVMPELGKAMAAGLRLENITGATLPLSLQT